MRLKKVQAGSALHTATVGEARALLASCGRTRATSRAAGCTKRLSAGGENRRTLEGAPTNKRAEHLGNREKFFHETQANGCVLRDMSLRYRH